MNNHIKIKPFVNAGDVKAAIEKALVRNAETDARSIHVNADGGRVTLSGNVRSLSERDEAARAKRAAAGVHAVENDLVVVP